MFLIKESRSIVEIKQMFLFRPLPTLSPTDGNDSNDLADILPLTSGRQDSKF